MAKKRSSYLFELNKIIGIRTTQGVRVEQRGHDDDQLKMYPLPSGSVLYDNVESEEYENVEPSPTTDQQMQGRHYENITVGFQATKAGNDSDKVINKQTYANQNVVIGQATKPSLRTELDAKKVTDQPANPSVLTNSESDAEMDCDTRLRVMKKNKVCIATYIFLTVLAVMVVIALVVGAVGVRESSKAQIAIDALTRHVMNNCNTTSMMSEMKRELTADVQIYHNTSHSKRQLGSHDHHQEN